MVYRDKPFTYKPKCISLADQPGITNNNKNDNVSADTNNALKIERN